LPIACGFPIAIEAAVVVGSKQPRRSDMASIGSFKKSGGEFQGEIVTLSVQTNNVYIVPETNRANDSAPSHRVYVGRAEIGAAWSKRSTDGRDYLSVKLDDTKRRHRHSGQRDKSSKEDQNMRLYEFADPTEYILLGAPDLLKRTKNVWIHERIDDFVPHLRKIPETTKERINNTS
jgi:uncharacterized protein (DUF736 family)